MSDPIQLDLTRLIREAVHRITGGNMAFVDDDLAVLEMLAFNAVQAGAMDHIHPDLQAKAIEAVKAHPWNNGGGI